MSNDYYGYDGPSFPYYVEVGPWSNEQISDLLIVFTALAGERQALIDVTVIDGSFGNHIPYKHPDGYLHTEKRFSKNMLSPNDNEGDFLEFGSWLNMLVEATRSTEDFGIVEMMIFDDDDEQIADPMVVVKYFIEGGDIELVHNNYRNP